MTGRSSCDKLFSSTMSEMPHPGLPDCCALGELLQNRYITRFDTLNFLCLIIAPALRQ